MHSNRDVANATSLNSHSAKNRNNLRYIFIRHCDMIQGYHFVRKEKYYGWKNKATYRE